jgi:hypothetical protein
VLSIDLAPFRKAVGQLSADLASGTSRELIRITDGAHSSARATTAFHDKTGALRQSIVYGFRGSGSFGSRTGFVRAGAKHASFIESGTKPHPIYPRKKKLLAFRVNGRWVYARRVRHPGTHATHFMKILGQIWGRSFDAGMRSMVGHALGRFNASA